MPKYHIEWLEEYKGTLYELRIVDDENSSDTWFTLVNYSIESWCVIFSDKIQIPEDVKGEFISEVLSRGLSYFVGSDFDKFFSEYEVTVCE